MTAGNKQEVTKQMSSLDAIAQINLEPECMRADQLARFLGVNRKTVYEYVARNVIPHRRLGRRIVFSRAQVVSWLGECKASSVGKAF